MERTYLVTIRLNENRCNYNIANSNFIVVTVSIVHTFDIYQCFYLFHLNSNGKIQFVRIEQHGYDR